MHPDKVDPATLTPADAAPQRARGPHPLPLFLALAAQQSRTDIARLSRILAGVRAYQAHGHARTLAAMPEVARVGGVRLRDYGGSGPPVVVVPSLINPPHVLDLAANNSLLRWLATQGVNPLLVDWGSPGPGEMPLDLGGYVTERLTTLIASVSPRPALLGYCLGGTLAIAAAALVPVRRVALIAAPWRFDGYGADARAAIAALWQRSAPVAHALGSFPIDLLQPAFWQLDPAGLVAKFERFPTLDPASAAAFVALEDWANTGPPLTLGVATEMFERWFSDDCPGTGRWRVGGSVIDPARLNIPILDIVSTSDRIVPAAAACGAGTPLPLAMGHVGMVMGSRARAQLWEPLATWLREG